MTFDEAMKAARCGLKVSPVGRSFFVYFMKDAESYRRVCFSKHDWGATSCDMDFHPTPYEKMMTWEIYNKNSPMNKVKNFFKRAIGSAKGKLSSNPA